MIVGISQPEHFPYIGYFQKMAYCDLFVLLDDVKFSGPRSFQNRNRFTNGSGIQEWFTVPVSKNSYFKKINEVVTAPDYGWRNKLIRKLEYHFPGIDYNEIYNYERLIDINMKTINLCRNYFDIQTQMIFSSELPINGKRGDLIYNICKYLGATTYLSGLGAKSYLSNTDFFDIDIEYIIPKLGTNDSSIVFIMPIKDSSINTNLIRRFEIHKSTNTITN